MKISLDWLSEYVDADMPPETLAHKLTMAGLEVEAVLDRYAPLRTVVAARILSEAPHPEAPGLKILSVDTGKGGASVVCGAPNARAGLVAPLALPGTVLADGKTVAESKVRGRMSFGMLCSEAELGIGINKSGLLELPKDARPGAPLAEVLNLKDTVFEIGLTPNRPDCLSALGIAREVSALTGKPLRMPDTSLPQGQGDAAKETSVTIEAPDHCPRYAARLLKGVTIGPSPKWLAERLLAVGQRPINNIVDVTNFVMLETGQPLHAFDFNRLEERRIVVRLASEGEKFTTLDNETRTLTADTLMICDGKRPVAVAGVMGGANSEIRADTKDVLIESAWFNPTSVRKTAKRLGLATEASHRFERGTDPLGCVRAADRAAKLMLEAAGGALVSGVVDTWPRPYKAPAIPLSTARCNALLGSSHTREAIAGYLASVGISTVKGEGDTLVATPPSHRVDVSRAEDLVEEVARLWGYDNIPVSAPSMRMDAVAPHPARALRATLRNILCGSGFYETIHYSFIHPAAPDRLRASGESPLRRQLPVQNPLSEDQGVMRTSLLPGLLETMARNLNQNVRDLKIFENGKVFFANAGNALPEEKEKLCLLMCGSRQGLTWHGKEEAVDFYDVKGAVEGLLGGLRITGVEWKRPPAGAAPWLKPGFGALAVAGSAVIGTLGEMCPETLRAFGVKVPAFVAELDVETLGNLLPEKISCVPLPRYPATWRDSSLVLDKAVTAGAVLDHARNTGGELLETAGIVALYEGKPIAEGKKSLSIRATYRAPDRTLTDEEANAAHGALMLSLLGEFKATVRLPDGKELDRDGYRALLENQASA
jgi:phenylalanyl-tRNA synthetase beta chain